MHNPKSLKNAAALAGALILFSCADAPPKPDAKAQATKEPIKAAEPSPARAAYFKMYKPAYEWSKDVQLLSMNNKSLAGMNGSGGKEAAWEAVLVSASKKQSRRAICSEIDSGAEVPKGVTFGAAMPWGGPTREFQPFRNSDFAVDSDAAYATASAKAAAWLKTHPNEKLNVLLAKASHYATPVWVFNWGDKKSGYVAIVNATSGDIISPN